MRRLATAALVAAAAACSRDTSLPAPPGAGSIQGRVVYAVPGQSSYVAAAGARVTVLGTSIGATTAGDGRFVVSNAALSDGSLLVQVDLDADGTPDRQTLLSLSALGARPGRDLALGDVVVVENARIRGRVLRADVPTATTGHAGTVVFVPQGPFTALTGDDGSYVFENLPEGRIAVTFFRDGYDPAGIDGIQLGAGQDFLARDVSIDPSVVPTGEAGPQPGAISGQLTFSPPASGAGATVAVTPELAGTTVSTAVSASGTFQLASVPAGLYRVEASKAGYVTAVVANVLVQPGAEDRLAISLAAQGVTVTPPAPAPAPTCVAGARCDLPNPCQVGQVTCVSGAPFCGSAGNALDGIPCGPNQVCSAGQCVQVCVGGASCRPPSPDQCREGVVSCTGGTPACAPGPATLGDGTSCGQDQVCHGGACVACVAGKVCTPANACHTGLTSCATGVETCVDTGLALGDGTACGSALYCAAGVCGACMPGLACAPAGQPCHAGQVSCATGRAVCADVGTALANGTGCGPNQVCFAGACGACTQGQACTPSNACDLGTVDCGSGLPVCVDEQLGVTAGTGCGTDRVCNGAGGCVACPAGQACTPPNPCHAGGIQCGTGAPVCGDLGVALANGTACGTDEVCLSGACVACMAGASCTPANPCHYGATSCATGVSQCGDTNVRLSDGASCGANAVCSAGACVACNVGAACDGLAGDAPAPGSPDPCKTYGTLCSTGSPACGVTGWRPDGTACPDGLGGSSWVCRSGACTQAGYALRVAPGGLGSQLLPSGATLAAGHGYPDASFVVTVQVVDVNGVPVLAPQTITGVAPAGAVVSPASAASSAANGTARFTVTLGRAVGPQTFRFTAATAYQPFDLALTADQPPDGLMIPLVNAPSFQYVGCAASLTGVPASGVVANLNAFAPAGVVGSALTTDVYFTENSDATVMRISPAGVISVVAGTACAGGYVGDGGTATAAKLNNPTGLALDERDPANPILYVADAANNRLRQVNLATGIIDVVAGDGTTGAAPPYGDGGDARTAQLSDPAFVAVAPDGSVYVSERGHSRVRRIAPQSGGLRAISTVAAPGPSCSGPLVLNSLAAAQDSAGSIAVDENGTLFVSGGFCGGTIGTNAARVVARLEPGGGWTLVAGGGSQYESVSGVPALGIGLYNASTSYLHAPAIAFDRPTGGGRSNLYAAVFVDGVVGRVDGATGRWDALATPKGTSNFPSGDFGPASAANLPFGGAGLGLSGRDLVVTTGQGQFGGLRVLAGVGAATASGAALAAISGGNQTIWIDESAFLCGTPGTCSKPDVLPLVVQATDGAGHPLSGAPGAAFSFAPGTRGGGTFTTSTTPSTDSSGYATASVRAGWGPGAYDVVARFRDLHGNDIPGSPVTFPITATAPAPGTVFAVVNGSHVSGRSGVGGAAVAAQIPQSYGVDLLPDGSLAFVSDHAVSRIDANGVLGVLAGLPGGYGYSGDGGPATGATFNNPRGIAVDRARQKAYVAEFSSHRIRVIDLATGIINTVAGTGSSASTGDGGAATAAALGLPERVAVCGGSLLVHDGTGNRIRRVGIDPANPAEYGLILPYLSPGATYAGQTAGFGSCGAATQFQGCNWTFGQTCTMAADPTGTVYVSGLFCGGPYGSSTEPGIARLDPGTGALQLVSGRPTGAAPATGQALWATRYSALGALMQPAIAFDPAGRLWIAAHSSTAAANFLGWVAPDATTGHVESTGTWNVLGQSTTPFVPPQNDFSPTGGYWFGNVFAAAVDANGHVFFADSGETSAYQSYSVRVIW